MKTSNLSADNFKKRLELEGSTPEPVIRSGDTGQQIPCSDSGQLITTLMCNINRLLTEREGRTGEYWPEVVAVRTERGEVPTATTEGQYSPIRPEQAQLVSCLLYGTLFLIVKCTSGGLHLKGFRRDVFVMTRAAQTKASYHEFEKQIY